MNKTVQAFVSISAVIGLWLALKFGLSISDRYLPGPNQLYHAIWDIGPANWWAHSVSTLLRTIIGYFGGGVLGIMLILVMFRYRLLNYAMPIFHSIRAVPAVAFVPFFLLWFGFSEIGRYLLVFLAMGLNTAVAAAEVLERPNYEEKILFKNFQTPLHYKIIRYWLPRVLEGLLPTMRFGISLALGAIVVSEMLGSQQGLGYLMQTSRATFSLNVIFLCAIILGVIATILDILVIKLWSVIVIWRA